MPCVNLVTIPNDFIHTTNWFSFEDNWALDAEFNGRYYLSYEGYSIYSKDINYILSTTASKLKAFDEG